MNAENIKIGSTLRVEGSCVLHLHKQFSQSNILKDPQQAFTSAFNI